MSPNTTSGTFAVAARDGLNNGTASFTSSTTAGANQEKGTVGSSIPLSGKGFNAGATVNLKYDGTTTMNFTFTIDSIPLPAPSLVTPAKDSKGDALGQFQWWPITDQNGGISYTLQITRDPNFTTVFLDKPGLTATSYQLTDAQKLQSRGNDKPYYWRVKATDSASNNKCLVASLRLRGGIYDALLGMAGDFVFRGRFSPFLRLRYQQKV